MEKARYNSREHYPSTAGASTGVRQFLRTTSRSIILTVSFYFIVMVLAEVAAITIGVLPAIIIDGIVLVGLANLYYFVRITDARRIILGLILVPMMRILSYTIPIPHIAPIFWYLMIGIPLLPAAVAAAYVNKLPVFTQAMTPGKWILQGMFGLIGIPLGLFASLILPAATLVIPGKTFGWVILGTIILTLFSAFIEEIIFRGLIQHALSVVFGPVGIILTSIFYAMMYIGTLQPGYVIFFGLTGWLFSLWVRYSRSLWGVILAHSLLNAIFFLLLAH